MDAAKLSSSRIALLISFALLIPASAFSQSAFNLAGSSSNSAQVTLISTLPSPVSVTSSTSPTEITYKAVTVYDTGSNGVRWLCLNPSPLLFGNPCDTISGLMTPDTLDIAVGQNANSSLLPQSQHTATITLTQTDSSGNPITGGATGTITVYYTPGSNGGTTGGTLTSSPSSLAATVGTGGETTVYFTLLSSSTTPISFTLQSPSPNWVSGFTTTNGLTSGTVSSSSPVNLQVTLNGAGQLQSVLNTSLLVTYGPSTLQIPISFGNGVSAGNSGGSGSITVSQSSIPWTYTTTVGNFPSPTSVYVSSSSGAIGFGTTTSPANAWFYVSPVSGTLPATLTISPTANIGSLAAGTYNGVVNITGTDNSTQAITITLVVNGGSANGLTVTPNPVNLQTPVGGSSVQQSVSVSSTTGGTLTASVSGTGLTVAVSNNFVTANIATTPITVTGNPTGLTNGTYIGSLTVTVGGVSQAVPVNFTVGNGTTGNTGSFAAAPPTLNFVYEANSVMPSSQQQFVYLTGSGNYTANVTNTGGGSWLSVPTSSGTLPTQYAEIAINASGLVSGSYSGAVTFTNTSTSQTAAVNVNLLVTGTTAAYASPGNLIFNYIGGTSSVSQVQNLNIFSSDNSVINTAGSVSNTTSSPWLSVTTNGSNSYSVTANASNLANGLYTGYLTVTTSTGNSPLTVPVVLNVTGSSIGSGSGGLTLGTSSLTFQPAVGGVAATQQLSVSAVNTTTFTAGASTNNGNSTWLSVSPAGTSVTNTTLTVTANPAGLVAGTYTGQITLVTGSGTQTVPVTMIVGGSGGGGTGNLTVTANGGTSTSPSLTFTAQSVGAAVLAQYLTVTSASGSSGVSFTASLSGTSCTWVALGINAGQAYTTPLNQLSVGATTTGVAAGTYNCTLTLTPSGGTAVTVPLTLTVIGQPTISISPATLSFSYAAGSAVPSAQTVTVTGAGATAPTFTATAAGTPSGWLSVSPASGTASAPVSLSVSVNPSGLAAGTYNGTVTVTPGTGATGGGTVTVTLTVTAPTPAITTIVNGASFLGGGVSPGEFITLMGTSLGPLTPLGPALDSTGKVATTLGNVQVFFSSTPAPLTYVSSGQINCIVPYEVNGLSTVPVKVVFLSQPSNVITLNVQSSAPGIFSATGTGTGQGSILNQNFIPNSAGSPAAKGSIVQIYMTGEGVTSPPGTTGAITANATTVPVLPIAVMIGGQPATVVFAGEAPGLVAGVLQINVMIPPTVSSGANQVSVTIGSNTSQPNLTVAVQ